MSTLSESLDVPAEALPSPRAEAWRRMPLRALERRAFVHAHGTAQSGASSIDPAQIGHIPAPRLVFVNGVRDDELSNLTGLDAGIDIVPIDADASGTPDRVAADDSIFTQLAASAGGVCIRFSGHVAQPLHVVHMASVAQADTLWHLQLRVEVAANGQGQLVEHQIAATPNADFANLLLRATLDENAALRHLRIQDAAEATTVFLHTDVHVSRNAGYHRMDLDLGAALSRHELNIRLAEDGATAQAHGVLLGHSRRHAETRLQVVHGARDTRSDLEWRGLVADRARVVFHGGIRIDEGADGSDAHLDNRNLLLSDNAEINTQPVLVIHADEVKAAHGATVGQLDANALFYLRSRGIPDTQARRILTAAFVQALLSKIENPALRESVEQQLGHALARIGTDFEDTRA